MRVYLRNNSSPYSIVDSANAVINASTYTGTFFFENAPTGTYYLQVKHRNHLETWSKSGGEPYVAGSLNSFNFTSANANSFGSNQASVGSLWGFYGGDVAGASTPGVAYGYQDGTIDASDISEIDNDVVNVLIGYYKTDVNGDDIVDAADLSFVENIALLTIFAVTP
ncbi:MAG: hypothetical protein LH629_05020 [Ignavibacteria bacterium]|nr:hypothetical protein [Ignavibacteria bacterium]